MKTRSTTPVSKGLVTQSVLVAAAVVMTLSIPMAITTSNSVYARDYEAEIQAVQNKINAYQDEARKLSKKAQTLENELAKLTSEKASIQAKVDLSQAKHDKLKKDIKDNEKKIADNRDALGLTIADMYVDTNISPLEMLASSNNIGDYVDKQTYQASMSKQLSDKINEIQKLKAELEKQRVAVTRVLADQTNQRNALAEKEAERSRLVRETRGKESAYQDLTEEAKAKKKQIVKAQQDAIAAAYNNGGGGMISAGNLPAYASWAGNCYVDNAGYSHGGNGGGGQDPVGYGCNQCVSYTAWKMGQVTGYIPSYWGNANMWPNSARNAGFKVTSQPRAKSLGVISAGQWGHIVYVESVNSDGTLNISQYNEWLPGKGFGHYSTRNNVSPATYDTYIYL